MTPISRILPLILTATLVVLSSGNVLAGLSHADPGIEFVMIGQQRVPKKTFYGILLDTVPPQARRTEPEKPAKTVDPIVDIKKVPQSRKQLKPGIIQPNITIKPVRIIKPKIIRTPIKL